MKEKVEKRVGMWRDELLCEEKVIVMIDRNVCDDDKMVDIRNEV